MTRWLSSPPVNEAIEFKPIDESPLAENEKRKDIVPNQLLNLPRGRAQVFRGNQNREKPAGSKSEISAASRNLPCGLPHSCHTH